MWYLLPLGYTTVGFSMPFIRPLLGLRSAYDIGHLRRQCSLLRGLNFWQYFCTVGTPAVCVKILERNWRVLGDRGSYMEGVWKIGVLDQYIALSHKRYNMAVYSYNGRRIGLVCFWYENNNKVGLIDFMHLDSNWTTARYKSLTYLLISVPYTVATFQFSS